MAVYPELSPKEDPRHALRPHKFGYLLLVFILLTLGAFWAVQRYAFGLARFWNYDIRDGLFQDSLYALIFALCTALAYLGLRFQPVPLRKENQLRAAFIAGLLLSMVVANWKSRFGDPDLRFGQQLEYARWFLIGSAGVCLTVILITWRHFGLVEVIAEPDDETVQEVRQAHSQIKLASTAWDQGKRLVELLLSAALIVIVLPISSLLALALWFQDPGPLLVAKVVVKRGGKSFGQYKLRTMIKAAEAKTGPVPAAPEDSRVTRLGHVLRRTHIDELPQLINILRGDMSLVGPRPERTVFVVRHVENIVDYPKRHAVRPGLAGMAQVHGDYYSTPREKLHYDLLYIRSRSALLDLKLFGAAVFLALFGVSPHRRGRSRPRPGTGRWHKAYEALRGEALKVPKDSDSG